MNFTKDQSVVKAASLILLRYRQDVHLVDFTTKSFAVCYCKTIIEVTMHPGIKYSKVILSYFPASLISKLWTIVLEECVCVNVRL